LQSFSSSFKGVTRKRILRKIWTAFDSHRTGRITQREFYAAIHDASAEVHAVDGR
jgi:hypothetical protein